MADLPHRPLGRLSAGALRLAIRDLPPAVRDQYEMELRDQLSGMSGRGRSLELRRQLALSVVISREQSDLRRVGVGLSWRCVLNRHLWVRLADDDPESNCCNLLECTRCGHRRDLVDFRPPPDNATLYNGGF